MTLPINLFYSSTILSTDGLQIMKWVMVFRLYELFGYTDDAVRAKIQRGIWLKGIHWKKAPDGHIFINVEAVQKWIEKA